MSRIDRFLAFGVSFLLLSLVFLLSLGHSFYNAKLFLGISSFYIAVFFLLGFYFWRYRKLGIIAGAFALLTVAQVPVIIYQLQQIFRLWRYDALYHNYSASHWCHTGWLVTEVSMTVIAFLVLCCIRIPLFSSAFYLLLWVTALDNFPRLFSVTRTATLFYRQAQVSMILGAILIVFGYFWDRKKEKNFALWAYFFGALFFLDRTIVFSNE